MTGVMMLFLVGVLAAGALGGALPLLRGRQAAGGRILGWGNALAAGIFLGAGLVHMLPQAARAWDSLGVRYPMAFLLAAAAFVLMLLVEHVLLPEGAHEAVHAPSIERFEHLGEHGGVFTAYAVLAALSVHSLFAGLALGSQTELAGAVVIFVAVMAHKSTEGFALGVSLVRNHMPARRAWGLLSILVLATPAGIVLGLLLGGAFQGRLRLALEAALLAVAAGTFAYVATLDILRDEFHAPGGRLGKWLCVASGTALMGVLALWI